MVRSIAFICSMGVPGFAAALGGCSDVGPIRVESEYGPGMKFAGLGPRYDWAAGEAGMRQAPAELESLIHRIIERNLANAGFVHIQDGQPAFRIRTHVARRSRTDSGVSPHGVTVEEGALVLDVLDATSAALIWRGVAQARLEDSQGPEFREKRLNVAVAELMKKFPAKADSHRTPR